MADFLLEIGSDEIPDWMILPALENLRVNFSQQTSALGASIELLDATPRRLVLIATALAEQLPDVEQVVTGPYLSAGLKAAEGFAKKNNTTVDALLKEADAKGERYIFAALKKGESAQQLLTRIVPSLITGIPWPKTMYWTGRDGVRFIRPIHWLVALLNNEVLPVEVAGIRGGNTTRGHRVLGSKNAIVVSAATYEAKLRDNGVIVRAAEREERIAQGLGPDVEPDDALLSTLVYLTEFPTPIRGSFDPAYLELPREILTTVMRHHQRYFSVLTKSGELAPAFVTVTNTDGDADGLIQRGNQRVLKARFNDARFFWQVDQRKQLTARVDDLAKVTFQAKLGSYREKTDRVVALAASLAAAAGADATTVRRAALLLKCDLTTDMVKEFTELQGIVGGLYAKAQGETEAVATAIYDQYKPVSMEDSIPRTLEAQIVAIADKLDTLQACFAIGLIPSGSKDPFALRRAAQGLIKILFEAKLPLPFESLPAGAPQLGEFLTERVHYYLREIRGFAYDEVNAVLAAPITTAPDVEERLQAVHDIRPTSDFEPLAASFKRIKNILRDEAPALDTGLLKEPAEIELHKAFETAKEQLLGSKSYAEKLSAMASLRPQVDLFFDKILVNDPDPALRGNRRALLQTVLTEFSSIADFSEIVTQGV